MLEGGLHHEPPLARRVRLHDLRSILSLREVSSVEAPDEASDKAI
jgi:hypothetical protein